MSKPFIDRCLAGEAKPDDIDDHVDLWHAGDGAGMSLAQYLGMTDAEYRAWAFSADVDAVLRDRRLKCSREP